MLKPHSCKRPPDNLHRDRPFTDRSLHGTHFSSSAVQGILDLLLRRAKHLWNLSAQLDTDGIPCPGKHMVQGFYRTDRISLEQFRNLIQLIRIGIDNAFHFNSLPELPSA